MHDWQFLVIIGLLFGLYARDAKQDGDIGWNTFFGLQTVFFIIAAIVLFFVEKAQ